MFVPNFRRCPLSLKLMSFVHNVSKSCTLCSLGQTQLSFFLLNLIMCKAHEGIIVISFSQGLFCKQLLLRGYFIKKQKNKRLYNHLLSDKAASPSLLSISIHLLYHLIKLSIHLQTTIAPIQLR
ncbi:hypothetical protein Hanom_Chr16g01439851 [Helianthus anomalus]